MQIFKAATVIHGLRLVESEDSEVQIWRNCGYWSVDYKLYLDFQLHRGLAPLTPSTVQGLMVFESYGL